MKDITETHPSFFKARVDEETRLINNGDFPAIDIDKYIQKHTRDIAKIREAIKKVLTTEYDGQVAVMPEYYKILKELEIDTKN